MSIGFQKFINPQLNKGENMKRLVEVQIKSVKIKR